MERRSLEDVRLSIRFESVKWSLNNKENSEKYEKDKQTKVSIRATSALFLSRLCSLLCMHSLTSSHLFCALSIRPFLFALST